MDSKTHAAVFMVNRSFYEHNSDYRTLTNWTEIHLLKYLEININASLSSVSSQLESLVFCEIQRKMASKYSVCGIVSAVFFVIINVILSVS